MYINKYWFNIKECGKTVMLHIPQIWLLHDQFIWCSSLRNYQMKLKVFFMIKSMGWVDITVHSLHFKNIYFLNVAIIKPWIFAWPLQEKLFILFQLYAMKRIFMLEWQFAIKYQWICKHLMRKRLNRQFSFVCLRATGMHMFFRYHHHIQYLIKTTKEMLILCIF